MAEEITKPKTFGERQSAALANGKKYLYLVCPLCRLSKPMRTHLSGKTVFSIEPNPEVIQTRYGMGGRGQGGFFKNEGESIKFKDLEMSNPTVYSNLKEEVGKLYKMLFG